MKKTHITSFFPALFVSFLLLFFSGNVYSQQQCCCDPIGCTGFGFGDCDSWCPLLGAGVTNAGSTTPYANPAACTPACVLPIELEYFTTEYIEGKGIEINWRTISETDNLGFEIQRAIGVDLRWETIAIIAGQGTTTTPWEYSHIDESPNPGVNYYRLRQMDFNGTESFSDIEVATVGEELEVNIWPTWAKDYVFIRIDEDSSSNQDYLIEVYDLMGRRVIVKNRVSNILDISNLSLGHYVVNVSIGYQKHTMRFVKVE